MVHYICTATAQGAFDHGVLLDSIDQLLQRVPQIVQIFDSRKFALLNARVNCM